MPRLFVAIDLPEEVRRELAGMCCGLPGARWLPPEQLHLTLRFIGEVDSETQARIIGALAEVVAAPLTLRLRGVGFFPPRGLPRVLWVGVERCEGLSRLQRRVEQCLLRAGLAPEGRKFMAHVTLARLHDTPGSRIGSYLALHNLYASPEIPVDRFVLYDSILNPRGARHYPLQDFFLV
ncbi:MAG: 2'-5' RNA ligase [Desulfobulbaceae bacterium A2]|nr:MAG: 2'-5' RNA ligase [Desulfobulbaceae bacterium A2]